MTIVKADREPSSFKDMKTMKDSTFTRQQVSTNTIWNLLWIGMTKCHQFVYHLGIRLPSMNIMDKREKVSLSKAIQMILVKMLAKPFQNPSMTKPHL